MGITRIWHIATKILRNLLSLSLPWRWRQRVPLKWQHQPTKMGLNQ